MISHDGKFIFFHNPKAAGTSVSAALFENSKFCCHDNASNEELVNALQAQQVLWPNHAHPSLIRDFWGAETFASYFKFSFVRDPRARLVSLYFYVRQKEQEIYQDADLEIPAFNREIMESESFEAWLLQTKNLPVPQMEFFTKDGEFLMDFVGKTEELTQELQKISRILGIETLELSNLNSSDHQSHSSYFTPEMNRVVKEKYHVDFSFFGYEID